jgi:ribosomal protein S1
MLEIGSVVDAEVIRIMPFGLYLKAGDDTVLLTVGQISWTPTRETSSQFKVGQTLRVLVERFDYAKKVYAGSIRLLTPELNPYREFSMLPAGTVLRGRVKMTHQNGVTVELNEWCSGELPLTDETSKLTLGTEVEVQITSLELSSQDMTLKLAGDEESKCGEDRPLE